MLQIRILQNSIYMKEVMLDYTIHYKRKMHLITKQIILMVDRGSTSHVRKYF